MENAESSLQPLLSVQPRTLSIISRAVIVIPGEPIAWARPAGSGKRRFTPDKQRTAKEEISWEMARAWRLPIIEAGRPVFMTFDFVWKAQKEKDIGRLRPKKPDTDNLEKLIMDAGNEVVYEDDGQIVSTSVRKFWGPESFTRVYFGELDL